MTDPIVGSITATEVASLSAAWQAVMTQHEVAGYALGTAMTQYEATTNALAAFKAQFIAAIVTDPAAPPVVEPEPPIAQPPTTPPSGDWNPPYPVLPANLTPMPVGEWGGGPGDQLMKEMAQTGGVVSDVEITGNGGGSGWCFGNDRNTQTFTEVLFRRSRFLPYAPSKTKWGKRWYHGAIAMEDCETIGIGPEHSDYFNITAYLRALRILTRGVAGQALQVARRNWTDLGLPVKPPYASQESGKGATEITVDTWIAEDHHNPAVPMSNAGGLFSIYDQPEALVTLRNIWIKEDLWDCLGALNCAADDFPDQPACKALTLENWNLRMRSPKQSLFWIYSVPEVHISGINGTVSGDQSKAHIRIDPPGVERPVRCKRVTCSAGTLDLPILVGDKVIGSTGQSFEWKADSAPIGTH